MASSCASAYSTAPFLHLKRLEELDDSLDAGPGEGVRHARNRCRSLVSVPTAPAFDHKLQSFRPISVSEFERYKAVVSGDAAQAHAQAAELEGSIAVRLAASA